MAEFYETLVYKFRKAFNDWESRLASSGIAVSPDVEKLIWELLVLAADNLSEPSIDTDEEISEVAYNVATEVLKDSDLRKLNLNYRDNLVETILQQIPHERHTTERMIHFSNLVSDAYREAYADRLRRMISRQRTARLSEELMLAKRIQERLLPKQIPEIPGFQIAGRVIPAREVGGDYWSVKYYEEDGVVTMKLADITGHGIAAATLVAAVKFISGGYYRGASSAHEVIERTNRILVRETPVEVLVTMVYCWLYPERREIDLVNAGHEPVFLCSRDECSDILPTGQALGVSETSYGERRLKMQPGDILFFCSDGITEVGLGQPFGKERVKDLVQSNKDKSAEEIADTVIQTATDYAGQPHDDMSLVVVKAVENKRS